jgi:hypothetical protein
LAIPSTLGDIFWKQIIEESKSEYFCGEQKMVETKWQMPSKNEPPLEMLKRGDQVCQRE